MAEEDRAAEALQVALAKVIEIPRPTIRNKILHEAMTGIATYLGYDLVQEWTAGK